MGASHPGGGSPPHPNVSTIHLNMQPLPPPGEGQGEGEGRRGGRTKRERGETVVTVLLFALAGLDPLRRVNAAAVHAPEVPENLLLDRVIANRLVDDGLFLKKHNHDIDLFIGGKEKETQ